MEQCAHREPSTTPPESASPKSVRCFRLCDASGKQRACADGTDRVRFIGDAAYAIRRDGSAWPATWNLRDVERWIAEGSVAEVPDQDLGSTPAKAKGGVA
jgi:hypothetical protein